MTLQNIHNNITEKLAYFIEQRKIPHILFHGPSGSGKRTLVYKFISDIYNNDKQLINKYTMFANCAHGKGIKFIRDELKFFAKTNINIQGIGHFKTIVLTNADKLTADAQSALRRCIEIFSHNTRFFIIVENKNNLLKPILSRLCEIYIAEPIIHTSTNKVSKEYKYINLNTYNLTTFINTNIYDNKREQYLDNELNKLHILTDLNNCSIVKVVNKLYEKGYSGLDLMNLIEKKTNKDIKTDDLLHLCTIKSPTSSAFIGSKGNNYHALETCEGVKNYTLLMLFHKVKSEIRSEKIFMTFIINSLFTFDKNLTLIKI